ncbi:MAG TPA: oligopeptidase B [Deltaproteobacteria bacterium]|nr:oligopeptidase B [Deltaproteobacteria bacterium]
MSRWFLFLPALLACAPKAAPPNINTDSALQPPLATEQPHTHTEHGVERSDPYYWLRERENPDVISYLESENAYAAAQTAHLEGFRKALFNEMVGRIQETDLSVPVKDGPYWYYSRTEDGLDYSIPARRLESMDAEEEVLLDLNQLDHEYIGLGAFEVSPDHNLLAYSLDTTGREVYDLRFIDLRTGEHLPDVIEGITANIAWATDNATIFYTRQDAALRPYQIARHTLGQDGDDAVVWTETDDKFRSYVWRTRSDGFMVIGSFSSLTTEMRVLDADQPDGAFTVFAKRHLGHEYSIEHQGERWLVLTNNSDDAEGAHDQRAVNRKLMEVPVGGDTERAAWTEVVAHREAVTLTNIEPFSRFIILTEREGGLEHLRVMDLETGTDSRMEMPEPLYTVYGSSNPNYDTTTFRIGYQSMVTPRSVYDVDLLSGERTLLKETPVLGGYDRTAYTTERRWATSADGTKVPMSVLRRNDTPLSGSAPVLLYGYGSYGATLDPWFSSTRLSLVDRGVVYVVCHPRGGGELGETWYRSGKFHDKQNTFTDFAACGDQLVADGWTSPKQMAIQGGSAGGLLVGAVINQRPDLAARAVAQVPFVDVVTTMLDESIPLTAGEWEEWGDPRTREYFDTMLAYSPYDNVTAQKYPDLLVTAGLNDPRVQYWEPAKWVAKLRVTKTGDSQVLLKTNMAAGHGGKSGRYGAIEDVAYVYAWLLDGWGLAEKPETTEQ